MIEPEDVGYLKSEVSNLKQKVDAHIEWEEKYHHEFSMKLDKIEDVMKEHLTMFRFFKTTLYTIVLIISFKFGEIKNLWSNHQ